LSLSCRSSPARQPHRPVPSRRGVLVLAHHGAARAPHSGACLAGCWFCWS